MHQVLPLGANATVHCLPEPNGSRPEISWTIDTTIPYETHLSYYNGMGIVVHLTADNISFVTVEGRQDNIIDGGRKFSCRATDKNNRPIASDTAIVEFYGKPVSVVCTVYLLLSVYYCWLLCVPNYWLHTM